MQKTVVAFLRGGRLGSISVDCPGLPPAPPSSEEFEAEARRAMIASGALSETDAATVKFVVQD